MCTGKAYKIIHGLPSWGNEEATKGMVCILILENEPYNRCRLHTNITSKHNSYSYELSQLEEIWK